MDFSTRLDELNREIAATKADPIQCLFESNEPDTSVTLASALLWLSERQKTLTKQSLSSNGLLTEARLCDDTEEVKYDFNVFDSKPDVSAALKEIQDLEHELQIELQNLDAMKVDEIRVAEPVVMKHLERHSAEDMHLIREQTVQAQKRKREEQQKARQAEEKAREIKAQCECDERKLAELHASIDELLAALDGVQMTTQVQIVQTDPDAVMQLSVGTLRVPWTADQQMDTARAVFEPRGSHKPLDNATWERVTRSCANSNAQISLLDILMHVMEHFGDDGDADL